MKYELLGQIGYGPIGRMYVAKRTGDDALFAGKRIYHELCTQAEITELQAAFSNAQDIRHAAIAPTLDCETVEDTVVVVSELDGGESLATLARGGGRASWLGDDEARLRLIRQIADGLSAWHERGMTHGNIKPSNVRIVAAEGGASETRFRLADTIYGHLSTTRQLMRRSSRDAIYAAPEQFDGVITLRSDVYSFAMVALCILAGITLFAPGSVESIIQQKRQSALEDTRKLMELAPGLRRVFDVALAEDAARRFASVRDFALGLEEAVAENAVVSEDAARRSLQRAEPSAISRRRLFQIGASLTGFVGAFGVAALGRSLFRDGQVVTAGAANGQVLQPTRFESVGTLTGHMGKVSSLSWSPDGASLVSTGNDATVRRWRPDAATPSGDILFAGTTLANCAIFSPDGSQLAIGLSGGALVVLQTNGKQAPQYLQNAGSSVRAVAWSLDGAELVSASADGMLRVWNLGNGEAQRVIPGGSGEARAVAFLPKNRIISVCTNGALSVWNGITGDPVLSVVAGSSLSALALSPDASQVVAGGAESVARIWTTSALALVSNFPKQGGVIRSLAWSPDGIASGSDGGVVLIDDPSDSSKAVAKITIGIGVWAVAWRPGGGMLAVGTADGKIQLWRPA